MAQTVVGIFDKASEAQDAVEALVNGGFSRDQIDVSTRSNDYTNDATTSSDDDNEGGISGFFKSLFGDDDDDRTNRYSTVGQRGSIVTVHAQSEDEAEQAADILDDNGAVDVDERASQYGTQGYGATSGVDTVNTMGVNDLTTGTTPTTTVVNEGETMSVPVIQENLQVGKQTVETGGVRVRSRIVERPVEEHLRLRSERVVVQRNPVDRAATEADFSTFREGDMELTEHAERAVVAKEARIVEEVTVGKTVDERDEVIRDTVRSTDVDVEQINPTQTTTTNTTETYNTDGTRNL